MMSNNDLEPLELMLDNNGLSNLIEDLISICYLKVEHLRTNWMDESSACYWESDAAILEDISEKLYH